VERERKGGEGAVVGRDELYHKNTVEVGLRIDTTGCRPTPPLHVATAGKNNFNEEITPLLPIGIGELYCQTISNIRHASI
jgi:hypothetical protein